MDINMMKKPVYPVEPWTVTENGFSVRSNYRNETAFALSNGYIGTRGTLEEGYDFTEEEGLEGNFINGFYDCEDIRYGEWNYGFPLRSQTMLNVPDLKRTEIYLGEERLDLRSGTAASYRRTLHMKEGKVTRSFEYTSPKGKKVLVETERLVSFTHKNVMASRMRVTSLNYAGDIRFVSVLNGDVENHTRTTNPLVDYGPFGRRLCPDSIEARADGQEESAYYEGTAKKSGLSLACGMRLVWSDWNGSPAKSELRGEADELRACLTDEYRAEPDQTVTLDKFIAYTTSLDTEAARLKVFIEETLAAACAAGYERLAKEQALYMKGFWDRADIRIEGDDALQQGLRFNLFHIMQAAGRDGTTGMGAKGLTGEGYEGHYFWDTEMYALPVFIYTAPEIAKGLLEYRYHTLDQARARARVLGHEKGALYPWRTINGEEASTYYPLGTAQYHINADIAYAFWLYVNVTGDMDFLKEEAAEVLCETARVWADVGCFAECRDGRYCICAVTGPDEYNAIVDNNFYTNLMARENIRSALSALVMIRDMDREAYEELAGRLEIGREELDLWQRIVDHMYFPYDEKRGVYPLDDGFMMRRPWDETKVPPEKRHLLYENYHPLFIFRQRMSKQADAILGMYLHSHLFTREELERNYDFYQEVTLHHSSLSTCVFGIVACQIGRYEEAFRYFTQSARMDLDDYHENLYAGIHAANMAGTWQALVNGFAGLRTGDGKLEFHTYIPKQWNSYRFRILYQGRALEVAVSHGEGGTSSAFTLLKGEGLTLWADGKELYLRQKGETVYV